MEVGSVICLLELTVARVGDSETATLNEGAWLRDELVEPILRNSAAEVQGALQFAHDAVQGRDKSGKCNRQAGAG